MPPRLTQAVREFTRTLLSPYDRDDVLARLLSQTIEALDASGAGIMLADDSGKLGFAAASDDRVEPVELAQSDTDSGACSEAYRSNKAVVIADLTAENRWPGYTERALEQGFAAVIGVPLVAWGQTIGVLNVYRDTPTEWTAADLEACEIVAGMGAAYILGAHRAKAQHDLSEQLYEALRSRGVIERAKGIIMANENVGAEAAFDLLRELSMNRNQKLRDIAAIIAEHGWDPDV